MEREIMLAEGKAEQVHAGRTPFSWLAVRGHDGAFVALPHVAGQSGKLVWIPNEPEADNASHKTGA